MMTNHWHFDSFGSSGSYVSNTSRPLTKPLFSGAISFQAAYVAGIVPLFYIRVFLQKNLKIPSSQKRHVYRWTFDHQSPALYLYSTSKRSRAQMYTNFPHARAHEEAVPDRFSSNTQTSNIDDWWNIIVDKRPPTCFAWTVQKPCHYRIIILSLK